MGCRSAIIFCFLAFFFVCYADDESATPSEPKVVEPTEHVEEKETAANKDDEPVLVLGEDNFDDAIKNNPTILVEFYAPWCGHCKALEPEYNKAGMLLKGSDPPAALAKVDATVHPNLASRFDVNGYPTIKLFKNGEPSDYDGSRDADGIVAFMKKHSDPNWKPPPEAVLTLTKDNFDDTVNNAELILVEFYAPWCGHCKQLAPKYETAAKRLRDMEHSIPLAKVDATEEKDLASRYGVTGYPAMKVFRKGKVSDYNGPRDEFGIVDYMQKQWGDASKEKSSLKDLRQALNKESVTIVGFFESESDPLYQVYQDSANDVREDYTFLHTFNADCRNAYKVNTGSVAVLNAEQFYTKYEPKWHVFEKADASVKDLQQFYSDHSIPLVAEYIYDTKDKSYKDKYPLCLAFFTVDFSFDYRDATQVWRKKIADIAKDFKDITFAIADEDKMSEDFKSFGFEESGEELNIGCIGSDKRKYPMAPMEEYDADEVREFIKKVQDGKAKPYIKSQPIPKGKQGPVAVVVGNNFDNVVMDSKKDVLIEFYAPWCGHCKSLEPKYKKLAKKLKEEKNLVISKMDSTANDAPPQFKVEGFPTIYFAPSNNKDSPIKFDGNREVDDLVKFIKGHAMVSMKESKDEL